MIFRRGQSGPGSDAPPPGAVKPGRHEFEQVAPYYDALMAAVPYGYWVDYVQRLLAIYQAPARQVLDLACGTGQVGAELRRRGYEVLGADLSEPMVRACARQVPPLRAVVMDASRLGLQEASLDLVVCLFDSLNYLLEPEDLRQCFVGVHRALRPGKLIIFDLNTPRALQIGLFSQQDMRAEQLLQYRWEAHWETEQKLCRVDMWFRWKGSGGPLEFEETHYQRAYQETEVRDWLQAAGFSRVDSYEAYSLRPVTELTDRMYFVAQKETTGH